MTNLNNLQEQTEKSHLLVRRSDDGKYNFMLMPGNTPISEEWFKEANDL